MPTGPEPGKFVRAIASRTAIVQYEIMRRYATRVSACRHPAARRPAARPLRYLAGRLRHEFARRADDGNALVSELRDYFEGASERFNVPPHRCYKAIFKIATRFKSRNVSLIHLRVAGDIDLRFANGFPQRFQRKVHAASSSQTSTENSHRFGFGLRTLSY